jgi:hypothetical protein
MPIVNYEALFLKSINIRPSITRRRQRRRDHHQTSASTSASFSSPPPASTNPKHSCASIILSRRRRQMRKIFRLTPSTTKQPPTNRQRQQIMARQQLPPKYSLLVELASTILLFDASQKTLSDDLIGKLIAHVNKHIQPSGMRVLLRDFTSQWERFKAHANIVALFAMRRDWLQEKRAILQPLQPFTWSMPLASIADYPTIEEFLQSEEIEIFYELVGCNVKEFIKRLAKRVLSIALVFFIMGLWEIKKGQFHLVWNKMLKC